MIKDMVWTVLVVASPVLAAILFVGLVISVLQVATQVQEITLSYVPKLLTAAVMLLVVGGWMLSMLSQFALRLYTLIPALGH